MVPKESWTANLHKFVRMIKKGLEREIEGSRSNKHS
jgi:hypothetical protein